MEQMKRKLEKLSGVSLDQENNSISNRLRNYLDIYVLILFPTITTYTLIKSYPNVQDMADSLLSFFTAYFSVFSNYFFYFKRAPFHKLFQRLIKLSRFVDQPATEMILKGVESVTLIAHIYITLGSSCMALIVFGPGLTSVYQYFFMNSEIVWRTPFFLKCPDFLIDTPLKYCLTYLLLSYMIAISAISHFHDIVYLERSLLFRGYLRALQTRLKNINYDIETYRSELTILVEFHNEILAGIKDFQDGFGAMVSGLFILAIATLSSSIYVLIKV